MRTALPMLAMTVVLATFQARAGELAPAPQFLATYDRSFIERSGAQTFEEMLDTGILRYFFTGGRSWLVMVNGNAYSTTANNLDMIPLSAVERIEVLRGESLGTFGGHSATVGAFNLVLRRDLDGFDIRTVARVPGKSGGDALQGSVWWGGAFGQNGHVTLGIDVLDRQEIVGSAREHSRSEWTPDGNFADAKNVSVAGNTVFVVDRSEKKFRSLVLGSCDPALGYTGPLRNPSGIRSGDIGCGYAYGNVWWDSASAGRTSAILNLDHPLGESAEFRLDAIATQSHSAFRYAPSVDVFSISPDEELLEAINDAAADASPAFQVTEEDVISVAHRFIGHGNRDWDTRSTGIEVSATVEGSLAEGLGYEANVSAWSFDGSETGRTFVDAQRIREEIAAGRYDVADPLSTDPDHLKAIDRSSLRENNDAGARYLGGWLALEGRFPALGGRDASWTAGTGIGTAEAHSILTFLDRDGGSRDVNGVLGSGGTSYEGERDAAGAFAELSLPLARKVDMRVAATASEYNDVGALQSWRLGAEYRPTDILAFRGSWSAGDEAPSMHHLHSTASQGHPYVRCVPDPGPPPRSCDASNYRQVKRITRGNPDLDSSRQEKLSLGAGIRKEPFYFVADWYQLTTSDLPGLNRATWAMLNYPECPPGGGGNCIERMAGEITIHDSFANVVDTEVSGVNARFGARRDTDWGFLAMRGLWRYVIDSEATVANDTKPLQLPRNAVRIVTSVGRGDVTGYWAFNHRDRIQNSQGDGYFGSWTGHDLTLDWKSPFGMEGKRLTAGVYNVTDAKLSENTAHPSRTDGPRAAGWGRTFFVTFNMRF